MKASKYNLAVLAFITITFSSANFSPLPTTAYAAQICVAVAIGKKRYYSGRWRAVKITARSRRCATAKRTALLRCRVHYARCRVVGAHNRKCVGIGIGSRGAWATRWADDRLEARANAAVACRRINWRRQNCTVFSACP